MQREAEDLLKCDELALLGEYLPDNFGALLELLVLLLLQSDVVVPLQVVNRCRDHHERQQGRPVQSTSPPDENEKGKRSDVIAGCG